MSDENFAGAEQIAYAQKKVGPPSIGLIVIASLGAALMVLSTIANVYTAVVGSVVEQADVPIGSAQRILPLALNVLGLIVCSYIIYGGLQMRKLQSYDRAKSACIFAMIPCIGPCLILGIPFGIWGLVTLNDAKVKAAFEASVADAFR